MPSPKNTETYDELDDIAGVARPKKKPAKVTPDPRGPVRPKKKVSEKREELREDYSFADFFRDERLHLGVGLALCMAAIAAAIVCIVSISTMEADQALVHGRSYAELRAYADALEQAGNAVGVTVSQVLLVDTLGVGSFIVAFYLFMLGLACMHVVKIRFWSLSFRCLFSAAAVSVIVGLLTINRPAIFPLGGAHGVYTNLFLIENAGELGAFGVSVLLLGLLVAVFLHPIKSLWSMAASLIPHKHKTEDDPEVSDEKTDESPAAALDVDNDIEIDDNNDTESAATAAAASATASMNADQAAIAALNELDTGFGFDIDDPVEEQPGEHADEPAEPAVFEHPDSEPAVMTDEVIIDEDREASADTDIDIDEPAKKPADKSAEDTDFEIISTPDDIRHGDHIGIERSYDPRDGHSNYVFPPLSLLAEKKIDATVDADEQRDKREMIIKALGNYGIRIKRIQATIGPTVTLYEIVPEDGIKIAKIRSLEDDIALSLAAEGIRIIAPMPGRGTVGIEIKNEKPQMVYMSTVLGSEAYSRSKFKLPIALGSTISNSIYIKDLAKLPHLLVAGATGQGKSVGLNCIIASLLYSKHPDELKFVLVDPKKVEFAPYRKIANAFMAKLPDEDSAIITEPSKAVEVLNSLCIEMEKRYDLLQAADVREITAYNEKFTSKRLNPEHGHRFMPYIVMIVDEFADLMAMAGKEVVVPISRLAAKARAVGMHMIIATQRPSTDIITGSIKANFPARIAFKVFSSIDSKTILDRPGAHRLVGNGDMLSLVGGDIERVQCAFVSTEETCAICDHIAAQPGFVAPYELPDPVTEGEGGAAGTSSNSAYGEFEQCALFVASQNQASISKLQRQFSIGFAKAGRYVDEMCKMGIVGPENGSKSRAVLMTPDEVARLFEERRN